MLTCVKFFQLLYSLACIMTHSQLLSSLREWRCFFSFLPNPGDYHTTFIATSLQIVCMSFIWTQFSLSVQQNGIPAMPICFLIFKMCSVAISLRIVRIKRNYQEVFSNDGITETFKRIFLIIKSEFWTKHVFHVGQLLSNSYVVSRTQGEWSIFKNFHLW